jgi:hypothetical protein
VQDPEAEKPIEGQQTLKSVAFGLSLDMVRDDRDNMNSIEY